MGVQVSNDSVDVAGPGSLAARLVTGESNVSGSFLEALFPM